MDLTNCQYKRVYHKRMQLSIVEVISEEEDGNKEISIVKQCVSCLVSAGCIERRIVEDR